MKGKQRTEIRKFENGMKNLSDYLIFGSLYTHFIYMQNITAKRR